MAPAVIKHGPARLVAQVGELQTSGVPRILLAEDVSGRDGDPHVADGVIGEVEAEDIGAVDVGARSAGSIMHEVGGVIPEARAGGPAERIARDVGQLAGPGAEQARRLVVDIPGPVGDLDAAVLQHVQHDAAAHKHGALKRQRLVVGAVFWLRRPQATLALALLVVQHVRGDEAAALAEAHECVVWPVGLQVLVQPVDCSLHGGGGGRGIEGEVVCVWVEDFYSRGGRRRERPI